MIPMGPWINRPLTLNGWPNCHGQQTPLHVFIFSPLVTLHVLKPLHCCPILLEHSSLTFVMHVCSFEKPSWYIIRLARLQLLASKNLHYKIGPFVVFGE